jgi:hypothetical protein
LLKNLLYTALLLIFFGCSNSKNECENEQINPNGESELALLMRDIHQNTLEIKNNLFLNDSIENKLNSSLIDEFKYNYQAIKTANPTESNLRDDGIYNGYADLYINSVDKFLNNKSQKNYNSMVTNCIQCHQHFCLGAISKINKLYYKK